MSHFLLRWRVATSEHNSGTVVWSRVVYRVEQRAPTQVRHHHQGRGR